jgi:hypothetical protein
MDSKDIGCGVADWIHVCDSRFSSNEDSYCGLLDYVTIQTDGWEPAFGKNILPAFMVCYYPPSRLHGIIKQKITMQIHLDRDEWRASMTRVMNLRVP